VITLLPQATETFVVAHRADVVVHRLSEITSPKLTDSNRPPRILAGWVKDDKFQLIIRNRRLNSFMPVAEGTIEGTSSGCIVFLRYRLMPMTRLYLVLWSLIALVSGISLGLFYQNIFLGIAALGIIILIHGIAWANFNVHHKPLHDIIFNVLQ
jgi:hypothetical protein